jgi:hypothetical protein
MTYPSTSIYHSKKKLFTMEYKLQLKPASIVHAVSSPNARRHGMSDDFRILTSPKLKCSAQYTTPRGYSGLAGWNFAKHEGWSAQEMNVWGMIFFFLFCDLRGMIFWDCIAWTLPDGQQFLRTPVAASIFLLLIFIKLADRTQIPAEQVFCSHRPRFLLSTVPDVQQASEGKLWRCCRTQT